MALERQYPIVLARFALVARQSLATAAVVRGRRGGGRNTVSQTCLARTAGYGRTSIANVRFVGFALSAALRDTAGKRTRRCLSCRVALGQRGTADAVALWYSLGASRSALRGGEVDEALQACRRRALQCGTRHRPLWGVALSLISHGGRQWAKRTRRCLNMAALVEAERATVEAVACGVRFVACPPRLCLKWGSAEPRP